MMNVAKLRVNGKITLKFKKNIYLKNMIEIIDNILPFLFIVGIVSFIVFFILGVGYKLNNLGEADVLSYLEENIYFRASAILTIISFISIFSLSSYESKLSRTEIKEKIEKLTNKKNALYINDTIRKNDSLIVALINIKKATSGRNTGSLEINLKMKNGNEIINLMLLRDFNTKTKYWVYYSDYKTTSDNCVGEINTEFLNEYK
jgi:energy-coupling factor transporter transmembrane protein EcfT